MNWRKERKVSMRSSVTIVQLDYRRGTRKAKADVKYGRRLSRTWELTGCGDKRKKTVKDHAEVLKLVTRRMVASSYWEQIKKQ